MKSQQKENSSTAMTCEGCIFAEFAEYENATQYGYENTTQYGCAADRIRKFSDEGELSLLPADDGTTVFGINRFCNLYRDKGWLEKQQEQDTEFEWNLLTIAQKEVEPTFGIVVYDRNVTGRNLQKTAESIKNIDYDKEKIFVVINYIPHPNKKDPDVEKHVAITNDLNSHGIKTVSVLNRVNEPRLVDFNAFSKCKSVSHLIKMDSLSEIPKDMLQNIDLSLNIDMEKIILFRHKSISCVSFPTVNNEYLNHNDFDKMIMSIESAAKQVNMTKNV